jgi:hypothetical protein
MVLSDLEIPPDLKIQMYEKIPELHAPVPAGARVT